MQSLSKGIVIVIGALAFPSSAAADEYVPSCGLTEQSASKELKGQRLNKAREAASSEGCALRVVKSERHTGEPERLDRVNVTVKRGKVKKVVGIY